MKKIGIRMLKVAVFIVGFCLIFLELQKVLHYHWVQKEDLYTVNIMLKTKPADSYDVLYFGTSELKTAVFPTAIYEETGVTGYNLATTNKAAMTTYYQLEYALRYQNPKVVCCDFSSLYEDCLPSERETVYRKVVDTMPDRDLKWEMIKSIKIMDSSQSALSYVFPMLRYHSIWNELTEENFKKDYVYDETLDNYANGCTLLRDTYDGEPYDLVPQIWEEEKSDEPLSRISVEWYDRFIALCHERGIAVAALLPPALGFAGDKVARWDTTREYLESRGVDIIDYNTYEAAQRLGLMMPDDYMDHTHMSYHGALKVSEDLAHILSDRYGLPDHRNEESAELWNRQWDDFCRDYEVAAQ